MSFPHSWLITGFVTRLTRRVSLGEHDRNCVPFRSTWVHPRVFCWVRITWSLVVYVCFVDRCLSFCTFSFDHRVACSSSLYGFWLPLWYLQTLLVTSLIIDIVLWPALMSSILHDYPVCTVLYDSKHYPGGSKLIEAVV